MKSIIMSMFPEETPVDLIIEHAEILCEISKIVKQIVIEYFEKKDISDYVSKVSKLESKADDIKFETRNILKQKRIKFAFNIKDILSYLNNQEKLIDLYEDVAKKLSLNQIEGFDEEIKEKFLKLVDEANKSVEYLVDMIKQVKVLIESSFSKKVKNHEKKEMIEIESLEGEIDRLNLEIGRWIYSKKHELNCLDLIFFRETVKIFVIISDIAENMAEILGVFLE